jgi:hypothetical protein
MRKAPTQAMTVFGCFAKLCVVKCLLRLTSFRTTLRYCQGPTGSVVSEQWQANQEMVGDIVKNVTIAGTVFPGRARCLEQSLTLLACLRRRGVLAELRLGVRPYRFRAHAWVELDGVVLNDDPQQLAGMAVLPPVTV